MNLLSNMAILDIHVSFRGGKPNNSWAKLWKTVTLCRHASLPIRAASTAEADPLLGRNDESMRKMCLEKSCKVISELYIGFFPYQNHWLVGLGDEILP